MSHPVYNEGGMIEPMKGRLRLSPYYFLNAGKANLTRSTCYFLSGRQKSNPWDEGWSSSTLPHILIYQEV